MVLCSVERKITSAPLITLGETSNAHFRNCRVCVALVVEVRLKSFLNDFMLTKMAHILIVH